MSHGPAAFVAMFFDGWVGISRLLVLTGLVLTVVNALRFIADRSTVAIAAADAAPPVERFGAAQWLRGGYPSLWWPLALTWAGFWIGGRFRSTPWVVVVGLLVVFMVAFGLHLLRVAHARRGGAVVAGPAVGALLTAASLLLFGLLLTVRLVVVPDPEARVADGLTGESADAALRAVIIPAVTLVLVLVGMVWAMRSRGNNRIGETLGWVRRSPYRHVIAIVVVFGLFVAPLVGDGRLTFLGIATPEYGKILYLVVLASMLADYAYGFRTRPGKVPAAEWVRTRRHIWYPIAVFGAVGAASVLKGDIGPMIPMFVGTVAMIIHVLRVQAGRARDVTGRRGLDRSRARLRVALGYSRPLWLPVAFLVIIGVATMALTSYMSERGKVWLDPWVFTWSASCEPAPEGASVPQTPAGTEACQVPFASAEASNRSQIAQSLAVIADGGVWGKGLADTTSGRVPAASTDFILSVIWSKLGGLVVVLLAAVLALLAAALTRLRRNLAPENAAPVQGRKPELGQDRPVDPTRLFVTGLLSMVLGQFVFVLAATVNALPHSGITAPFLSRGGQSTIALGIGVIAAVAVQYRGRVRPTPARRPVAMPAAAPVKPGATQPSWWQRPRLSGAGAMFVLSLTLALGVTLSPYTGLDERRQYCLTQQPTVDSSVCSTDRIAYERTAVRVSIDGTPQYERDRSAMKWAPIGTPTLSLADLGGLLQVGGGQGALDLALTDVIDGTTGTSLADRLGPPSTEQEAGVIELSVAPAIQRAAATALRSDADTAPLAGGAVVLDAKTGRVLAAASAPGDLAPSEAGAKVAPTDRAQFSKQHKTFGLRGEDGTINEKAACAESDVDDELARCWRWSLTPAKAPETAAALADRRRYVDNDESVPAPGTAENRALGRRYGLGSTFKVVVAAAYLKQPNTSATDLVPAPATIDLGTRQIRNYNRGECKGTVNGKISLSDALAVSCNTAFVKLAEEMGWSAIRDTAHDLGFSVGPVAANQAGPAWLAGTPVGVDSRVPKDVDAASLGNNVLGGGQVVGTPLQMATVMATIANGGKVVQPTLVSAITEARGGERREVTGESRPVMTEPQADQLRTALAGTAEAGGTAATLHSPDGRPLWVKTGTHDLFGDDPPPPGQFVRQIAWLVGFVDTEAGPVAFAVAVETRDEKEGGARTRLLADQIIKSIVEVRR
jgi:cell division protein FtsI/penicillin-binding protein 2/cell division protein FtsW (lipid II flippase)